MISHRIRFKEQGPFVQVFLSERDQGEWSRYLCIGLLRVIRHEDRTHSFKIVGHEHLGGFGDKLKAGRKLAALTRKAVYRV